jgi:dihydroxyacetone kinase-like predicted kinase
MNEIRQNNNAIWDGSTLNSLFRAGTYEIMRHINDLNSIDVFPVPVASAGTKIYLTLLSGCKEVKIQPESTANEVAASFSRGTLLGARGHQGVPFSQWFRGFARGLGSHTQINTKIFASALTEAAATTYRSYVKPIDGDLWRVAEDVAKTAEQKSSETTNLYKILEYAIDEAEKSVARTPDLIPALKAAGVVHSGGQAFLHFLNGMKFFLDEEITENMLKDNNFIEVPKAG